MGRIYLGGACLGVPSFCVSPLQWELGGGCIKFEQAGLRGFFIGLGEPAVGNFFYQAVGNVGIRLGPSLVFPKTSGSG